MSTSTEAADTVTEAADTVQVGQLSSPKPPRQTQLDLHTLEPRIAQYEDEMTFQRKALIQRLSMYGPITRLIENEMRLLQDVATTPVGCPVGISDGVSRGYRAFVGFYSLLVLGALIEAPAASYETPSSSISENLQHVISENQHVDFSDEEEAWGYLTMIYTMRELAKEWDAFHLECETFVPINSPNRTEFLARLRLARSEMTKTLDATYKESLDQWCRTSPSSRTPAEPIHSFTLMALLTRDADRSRTDHVREILDMTRRAELTGTVFEKTARMAALIERCERECSEASEFEPDRLMEKPHNIDEAVADGVHLFFSVQNALFGEASFRNDGSAEETIDQMVSIRRMRTKKLYPKNWPETDDPNVYWARAVILYTVVELLQHCPEMDGYFANVQEMIPKELRDRFSVSLMISRLDLLEEVRFEYLKVIERGVVKFGPPPQLSDSKAGN
jgi:hypothetical protein